MAIERVTGEVDLDEGNELEPKTPVVEVPEVDEELEETDEEIEESEETEEIEEKIEAFPFERPSIKEINEKFPGIFKEFPTLRDSIFQEGSYRQIFPTIEDAQEAVNDNLAFEGLRDSILAGDPKPLLDAVEEADKTALTRLSVAFLDTLEKKDKALYTQTISPLFENFLRVMGKSRDENERNAALVAAMFLYGDDGNDIVAGKKTLAKEIKETPEAKQLKEEQTNRETKQYTEFKQGLDNTIIKNLDTMIAKGLDIDGTMTEAAKRMLVQEIRREIDKILAGNKDHLRVINSYWLRARKNGYSADSKAKIISAYLARVKTVVGPIRDKVRNDFLGIKKKQSTQKLAEIDRVSSKPSIVSGRASNGRPSGGKEEVNYRKMTDLDILNN